MTYARSSLTPTQYLALRVVRILGPTTHTELIGWIEHLELTDIPAGAIGA